MRPALLAVLLFSQTFSAYGADAARALAGSLYTTVGAWHICESGCGVTNRDWGADSLTYALALRWRTVKDGSLVPVFRQLEKTAPSYGSCNGTACEWSDVPEWDSIAASREYAITGDAVALTKAIGDYNYVKYSHLFALGACPDIHYQLPLGGDGGLKTLETDANAVKAALLLYGITHQTVYLNDAQRLYAAVQRHFLNSGVPLYTVYVFDDGHQCTQVPHRFFASVNGDMIYNGLYLYRYTRALHYLDEALATARAVETGLGDTRGVFVDQQAENDVVEPLVEAMYELATLQNDAGARAWIVANAVAALAQDRDARGWYGRFFDGPGPTWNLTAWQTNGGLALAIAAAALDPAGVPASGAWKTARFIADPIATLPSPVVRFTGRAIAFVGTIGDRCCQPGHATVILDGALTLDQTGIWQNKSSAGIQIPNAVLFAWRWPSSGSHTVQFGPGITNAKEGGPYLRLAGYYLVP